LQSASKLYRDGYHKVWSHTNFRLQDHADKPKSSKIKSGSCPLLMVWCLNDWYGCDYQPLCWILTSVYRRPEERRRPRPILARIEQTTWNGA
jgi:hypothetical protein